MRMKTKDKYNSILLKNTKEKIANEIILTANLSCIYAEKKSTEVIQTKVNHQLNAMEIAINRINPKFTEHSKNYDKVKKQMLDILSGYETNLKELCSIKNAQIQEVILKKAELETKLLMAILTKEYLYRKESNKPKSDTKNKLVHNINTALEKIKKKAKEKKQIDISLINIIQDGQQIEEEIIEKTQFSHQYQENLNVIQKLEQEIKIVDTQIKELHEQKIQIVLDGMEVGNKAISTQIRKPRTLKRITKFFANRFNPYKVIVKTVFEPIEQRIQEFRIKELGNTTIQEKEFKLQEWEKKVKEKQDFVFNQLEHKMIGKELNIL